MSTISLSVPLPASNGAGAPVDTSAMGGSKALAVQGPLSGQVTFQASFDGGSTWADLITLTSSRKFPLNFAADMVRAVRSGIKPGAPDAPDADVSGSKGGAKFASIPTDGSAVDVSNLGSERQFILANLFGVMGAIRLECSDDGVKWNDLATLPKNGFYRVPFSSKWVRATGSGALTIGAANDFVSESSDDDFVIADSGDTTAETLTQKLQTTGGASKSVVDKGGGNLAVELDSASQKQSLFLQAQISTSGSVFIDAMNGNSIQIPQDGNYVARFEAEGESSATSGVLETSISLNGVPQPDSQRKVVGIGPLSHAGSVDLGALTAGDEIGILLRKETGAGAVSLRGRNLVVTRVV